MSTPNPDPLLSAVYAEELAVSYGIVLAALRRDHAGLAHLMAGLTEDQVRAVTAAGLASMVEVLYEALPARVVHSMIRSIQSVADEHAANNL